MSIDPELLGECVASVPDRYDALVIPEESYGTTFWAQCKWLEKTCYNGNDHIESLRCLPKALYEEIGGHSPDMVFSEDKDLDLRIRQARHRVGHTKHILYHNE